ncbi:MAG TPA: hypothetical protein VGM78_13505, partial [Ilumatobacteraceae bacterium]
MQLRRAHRLIVVSTLLLGSGSVALGAPLGLGVARADAPASITLDGHGYGHGIGLSQYGALGYAINFGWSANQILDHYYGGTVASTAPASDITVRISGLDGLQTAVVGDKGTLVVDGWSPPSGQPATWHSLVARQTSPGHYRVWGR